MNDHPDDIDPGIDIDVNGAITSRAAAMLSTKSGRWRLLPAAGDLLIFARDDGTSDDDNAVTLSGQLTDWGAITNVMNYLHFNQLDGLLGVVAQDTSIEIFFQRGTILGARCNRPEFRIGTLLVRVGAISEQTLNEALAKVSPERRVGAVLVAMGALTSHELFEFVEKQATEIFFAALLCKNGAFYFRQGDDRDTPSRLQLDAQKLLLEGLSHIDEMSYFRAKIPDQNVMLSRKNAELPHDAEPSARALLAVIDSKLTLAEAAKRATLGEFAATKAAFQLAQTGHIELRSTDELRRETSVPDARLPPSAADTIIDGYNAALAGLYETMSQKGKAEPLQQGVTAFFAGSARFGALFDDVALGKMGALPADKLRKNVQKLPQSERLRILQTGLHDLLFFVLFVAGDLIGPREEKELHRRVAQALKQLPRA